MENKVRKRSGLLEFDVKLGAPKKFCHIICSDCKEDTTEDSER